VGLVLAMSFERTGLPCVLIHPSASAHMPCRSLLVRSLSSASALWRAGAGLCRPCSTPDCCCHTGVHGEVSSVSQASCQRRAPESVQGGWCWWSLQAGIATVLFHLQRGVVVCGDGTCGTSCRIRRTLACQCVVRRVFAGSAPADLARAPPRRGSWRLAVPPFRLDGPPSWQTEGPGFDGVGGHRTKCGTVDARGAVLILCDHLPSSQRLWVVGISRASVSAPAL
jgi:hypothetical protein